MTDLISRVENDVREIFGDIDNPNYQRIAELLREGPAYSDIRPIMSRFYVKDSTDENYDYCFSFIAKFPQSLMRCELSVVGPYFCVFSIGDRNVEVVDRKALHDDDDLKHAFSHLMEKRTLLDRRELEELILLNAEESVSGKCRIYNALFSASNPPWL